MAAAVPAPAPAPAKRKSGSIKNAVEKAVGPIKAQASRARKALATEKARKVIDHAEHVGGGIVGGAIQGADIAIEAGDMTIPLALPIGIAGVVGGMVLGQRDVGCLGVGMLTYGAGRLVEDVVADAMKA